MKKFTISKRFLMLCIPFLSLSTYAVDHGSVKGSGLKLYDQYNAGTINYGSEKAGVTFDYKVVTIGGKTWAWTNLTGATIGGATWASQLRYWAMPANGLTENNLLSRVSGTQQTYGTTTATIPASLQLTFFQAIDPGGNSETERIPYNPAIANSIVAGDNVAPVLTSVTASNIAESTAKLQIAGTDNASDLFYYISGNGISEVAFGSEFNLFGLSANTTYTLAVTPIDFSGNQGTPQNVTFTTTGLVQITSCIAKDIKVVLKSTATELEYYYEFTDPAKLFDEGFLQITPAGGTMIEVKPTVSPDRKYLYGKVSDSSIANKILSLNCGYLEKFDEDPNNHAWESYVMDNTTVTQGTNVGLSIKHQMGGGVAPAEQELVAPVLSSVALGDATKNYLKINISGSDNSGTVYYEITGAKETVHAFRTGDYYLTAIEPGKVYNLNIVAKDLSGNSSTAQLLSAKTMNARSTITDGQNMNYNTTTLPTGNGGELTTIIKREGNTLTIGCTTVDARYTGQTFHPKEDAAFKPTVEINGTKYDLDRTVAENGATAISTAQVVFTDNIDEVAIEDGMTLNLKWSVFWSTGNGNFFTGTFLYKVGDNGQVDAEGPTKPVLSLSGSTLTWAASTDVLSGVKYYVVTEDAVTRAVKTTTIFDLGQPSFSYTLTDPNNQVSVVAVDFVGNVSETAIIDGTTGIENVSHNRVSVYPNPATDQINISGDVAQVVIYSLHGNKVLSANGTNKIDVSALSAGVYLVQILNENGERFTTKIQVK